MDMFEYFGFFGEDRGSDRLLETETEVIMKLFEKYLPPSGKVLDSSAGDGTFAFRLAEAGYEVTAGDFITDHVEAMKADPRASSIKEFYCSSARNLSRFADKSFDIVISLGSMYHMRARAEREAFFRESLRVLGDGGTFAFSYMTPFALTMGQFLRSVREEDPRARLREFRKMPNVEKTHVCDMFSGTTLEELTEISREYGLEILTLAATYQLPYSMADDIGAFSDEEYDRFRHVQAATAEDPFVSRYAMRGLYIAKRKPEDMFD